MPSKQKLTVQEKKRVVDLYCGDGRGMETIARVMEVPLFLVEGYVADAKLKRGTPKTAGFTPCTMAEADKITDLYTSQGRGIDTIARVLGLHRGAVEQVIVERELTRANGGSAGQGSAPQISGEERIRRLQLAKEERELLMATDGEKSLRTMLESLVRETAKAFDPPPKYKAPKQATDEDTVDETLILMLSDWHLYERVDPERVRDLNAYDADIAARRVHAVVHSTISIKRKMERGGWRFKKLVVGLNGDIISGSIHEVERHGDAPSVTHAVYGAGLLLAQALRDLTAEFPEVEVFCTSGNHGRLPDARRVQQKDPNRSWDTLIAWFAKEHLRQLGDRIRFYTPNSYSVIFDVEGWNFLQTHGHDVQSWNGIPWYGINRMVSNVNALEAARGVIIHHYLLGHFHTATSLPHAAGESFINGSLIGGTEFSVHGLGKADRPSQWLLGVHREHGITHRWPLLAEVPQEETYDVRPWLQAK